MVDLIAFLNAQFDADAEIAAWVKDSLTPGTPPDGRARPSVSLDKRARGVYLAVFKPERMLSDIESKRRLLALHVPVWIEPGHELFNDAHLTSDPMRICKSCSPETMWRREKSWPCRTLRVLALPYADRDGYREEWRP